MSRVQATTKQGARGLGVVSDDSSDSPLSEPQPPQSRPSPSQQLRSHNNDDPRQDAANYPNSTNRRNVHGVEKYSTSPPATTATRHRSNSKSQPQPSLLKDEKPKGKRARKIPAVGETMSEKKEKPVRKPRGGAATKPARKKAKLEHTEPIQATLDTTVTSPKTSLPAPTPDYSIRSHDRSKLDASNAQSQQNHQSPPANPAPRMSYDPVRSMMVELDPSPKSYSTAPPPSTFSGPATPSKNAASRPSHSPTSISHIIDPPADSHQHNQSVARLTPNDSPAGAGSLAAAQVDGAAQYSMGVDHAKIPSSAVPSNAPSPKPTRGKEPAPLPQGSGLLTAALFGPNTNGTTAASEQAPNIIVHVKLAKTDNNIINFAQIAEEKYGFAALHPRLAAQRERLARVAAAGAILEKSTNASRAGRTSTGDSGDDDVSVDIDRDTDNDGDLAGANANGGGTGANSGTDATGSKKTIRKRKGEGYDQDDPFVDDSELAWEAQAVAVQDGYFVYAGPLVPEPEKTAERYVSARKDSWIFVNRSPMLPSTAHLLPYLSQPIIVFC